MSNIMHYFVIEYSYEWELGKRASFNVRFRTPKHLYDFNTANYPNLFKKISSNLSPGVVAECMINPHAVDWYA